jgi:hypothetical protein
MLFYIIRIRIESDINLKHKLAKIYVYTPPKIIAGYLFDRKILPMQGAAYEQPHLPLDYPGAGAGKYGGNFSTHRARPPHVN